MRIIKHCKQNIPKWKKDVMRPHCKNTKRVDKY